MSEDLSALKLAVTAKLPLIACTSRDVINIHAVVEQLLGAAPHAYAPGAPIKENQVHMLVLSKPVKPVLFDAVATYNQFMKRSATLIVVNPYENDDVMHHVGELPIPKPLMHSLMMQITEDPAKATELLTALGGTTLKDATEYALLTMARDQSLTPAGIVKTRKTTFTGEASLELVDTAMEYYLEPPDLKLFIESMRDPFLLETDYRLVPRGVLMDGPPGTGKTAGAKRIAERWGVPLYRMDIGAQRDKWLGNTEKAMLNNLSRLDHEEPCVVLMDEIEKIFGGAISDNTGTTTTMLSQLLWWLQEHRTRVFAVMTTNKVGKIPPELFREGRIDRVLYFEGLEKEDADPFVRDVAKTFGIDKLTVSSVQNIIYKSGTASEKPQRYTQAALYRAVVNHVLASKYPNPTNAT